MQLKLDARARRILRRLPRVNVYSFAELLLLAGLAVQAARLVWTVMTPISPLGDWRPAGITLAGDPADILAGFDPFFRLDAGRPGPAVATSLALTLFGIRVDGAAGEEATGRGGAILAGPDGLQRSIAVGEEIQPGITLKSVAFDHITIERGGVPEDLFLARDDAVLASPQALPPVPGMMPGTPPPSAGAGIPLGRLRSEIGFIPRLDGGRISGLVVRALGTGVAFRQAGLRDGDVVTAIGGRPVSGPADLDRIAADFPKGGNVPITVERGSDTLPLAITIASTP